MSPRLVPPPTLQGLNRIVAILLLFLDEEDAFWGLVTIVDTLMPQCYYDHTLIAAHADQVCGRAVKHTSVASS